MTVQSMFSQSIKWMERKAAPTRDREKEWEKKTASIEYAMVFQLNAVWESLNRCRFDYNRFSSFAFTGRASGIHKHNSNHHIHSVPCIFHVIFRRCCFFSLHFDDVECRDPFSVLAIEGDDSNFFSKGESSTRMSVTERDRRKEFIFKQTYK